MRLRTARKIMKAVGTPDEQRYTGFQIDKALARYRKTRSYKEVDRYWVEMLASIGAGGRAAVLAGTGATGLAFDLLMSTPEGKW